MNFLRGGGKEIEFQNGGTILNVWVTIDDLLRIKDEKGIVRFVIKRRSDIDKFGNTHMIYEDTYKRDNSGAGSVKTQKAQSVDAKSDDEMPF